MKSSSVTDVTPMFVERKVRYSALFTNLVGWHASAVSFPLSDIILAQLACPLSDVMFCLHSRITNLSLYKHYVLPKGVYDTSGPNGKTLNENAPSFSYQYYTSMEVT